MSVIGNLVGDITGTNQQASAAQSAAQTQANAANYAANLQNQQFQQLQTNLAPYMALGSQGQNLLSQLGQFNFNPSDLTQTPGYQFNLQQGLKAAANSASGSGLNLSGAQQKGLANYASGLASNTYQQQFQNALTSYNTNLQQANNLISLGQNAAAGVGNAGLTTAANVGNLATQAGNATAAGQIAAGNTQTNALSSLMGLGQGAAGIYALGNYTGGAAGATSLWSALSSLCDIRTKENISLIGNLPNGLNVYEFEYKPEFKDHKFAGHGKFIGLMAQEVERIFPEAVFVTDNGYKAINYSKVN